MDSMLCSPGPISRSWLRELLRPLGDSGAWDRLAARIRPTWSVNTVRAQVVERIEESADTVSLWLQPNRHWPGHRAGQHVVLTVEIDGVRRRRVFSLSSAPRDDRRLRITLQRQAAGGVTDWLHAHAGVGNVVELAAPGGDFVLPVGRGAERPLLMIAGGTGITPMLAMLQQLADEGSTQDVLLAQLYRNEPDRLFADELGVLAERLPGLSILSHASGERGRLDADALADQVPDLDRRATLLCGPEGLMSEVSAAWQRRGLGDRLAMERFAAPPRAPSEGERAQVHAVEAERMFTQSPGQTLLEAAEAAGLAPASGCRAGICRTCSCRKAGGRVRNLVTGRSSDEPEEWIQLCISVAETDLELSL